MNTIPNKKLGIAKSNVIILDISFFRKARRTRKIEKTNESKIKMIDK